MKYTKFDDIPQITQANYRVNVSWKYLEFQLAHFKEGYGLELEPDFQRAHVWTEDQQIAYIEWVLRGGRSGRDILWNCKVWRSGGKAPVVLVDGLQRITAVQRFLHNEIPAFGTLYNDYEDNLRLVTSDFVFYVNDLKTTEQVLQWYIDINAGGTQHSDEEIEKVKAMLAEIQEAK